MTKKLFENLHLLIKQLLLQHLAKLYEGWRNFRKAFLVVVFNFFLSLNVNISVLIDLALSIKEWYVYLKDEDE